jgi:hypothetical protein
MSHDSGYGVSLLTTPQSGLNMVDGSWEWGVSDIEATPLGCSESYKAVNTEAEPTGMNGQHYSGGRIQVYFFVSGRKLCSLV